MIHLIKNLKSVLLGVFQKILQKQVVKLIFNFLAFYF